MSGEREKKELECAKWEPYMEMGHPEIDAQHKRLIAEINKLCKELDNKEPDAERIKGHIKFLLAYAVEHFATEEKVMKDIGYPGFLNHYNIHRWFEKQVRNLVNDYVKFGPTHTMVVRIHHLLVDWLVSHICGTDGDLRTYYKSYIKHEMNMVGGENTPSEGEESSQ